MEDKWFSAQQDAIDKIRKLNARLEESTQWAECADCGKPAKLLVGKKQYCSIRCKNKPPK